MARISTYSTDVNVVAQDKWIGTDSNGSVTKNFTAQSIADFLNNTSAVAIAGQNNFFFQTDLSNGRAQGTISFTSGGGSNTAFASLTTIKISKYANSGYVVLNYLQTLVNQAVFVAQTDNVNNFGIYKLLTLDQDTLEPEFYNATFQLIQSHGALLQNHFYTFSVYPGFISYPFTVPTPTLDSVLAEGDTGTGKNITLTLEGDGIFTYGGVLSTFDNTDGNIGSAVQVQPYAVIIGDNYGQLGLSKSSISQGDGMFSTSLIWDTLLSNEVITIPNATGTMALTSDIPPTITLTTIGSGGAATLSSSGVLNIPNYSTSAPTLQSVTDSGNHTTNDIIVESSSSLSAVNNDAVGSQDKITNSYSYISSNAELGLNNNAGGLTILRNSNVELGNNSIYEFPNKSSGTYTLATTSDIPSTPTLQQVLDNNHALLNGNNLQGTGAGVSQSGTNVISFGNYSSNHSTGSDINAFGNLALGGNLGAYNSGSNVNAFGSSAGYSNTYNYVNLFGKNASADEDGQTVLSKNGTILARLSTSLLTDTRKYSFPNTSGTLALTSQIGTWGSLDYPHWVSGTPFVKMTADGVFALDTNTYITSPLTTKGDIFVRNSSSDTRLPIGLDTQVLIADSTQATGMKWGSNTAATPTGYYGAWQDDFTQTAAANNTGYAMKFHTADITPNGISIVNNGSGDPTRITFANTGIYNIQFSSQFQNTNNQLEDVTIWLRLNGVDLPGSAGFVSVPNSHGGTPGHNIAAWNYVLSVVAGDYYELMWSTTNHTNVTMQFYAAGSPPPSAASVILTVTQQSGIMAGTGMTSLTTTGSSGAATYNSGTGALNIPQYMGATTRKNANNSTNSNINYCGVAVGTGVSESSAVWTITRLTIASSGSITTAIATNVAWTNRESVIYT